MSRLKLLILDANVVIHLHEFGIWSKLIAICDVHLPRTVVGEADFFEVDGDKRPIDLQDDINQKRIQVFDVALSDIQKFRDNGRRQATARQGRQVGTPTCRGLPCGLAAQ